MKIEIPIKLGDVVMYKSLYSNVELEGAIKEIDIKLKGGMVSYNFKVNDRKFYDDSRDIKWRI